MARNWPYSAAAWKTIRKVVLRRDNFECQVRLACCTHVATAVDHIKPVSRGGAPFDPTNLRASCQQCNTALSNESRHSNTLPPSRRW